MEQSSEKRVCQNCQTSFEIDAQDFEFYEKIDVPPPTFCPECRMVRRMNWRNERNLYHRNCDSCNKAIISNYSTHGSFPVYCHECWISDKWDPLMYAKEINWQRPFLEQWQELMNTVPKVALVIYDNNVNSQYANYIKECKNVYLAYSIVYGENIAYSFSIDKSQDSLDCSIGKNLQWVYETINSDHCYNSIFLMQSRDCTDSIFLFDCVNCRSCFMSANLRNRQYVFRNQQLDKNQYEKQIKNINYNSFKNLSILRREYGDLIISSLHKYANITKSINCTGDNITNSKNAKQVFNVYDMEEVKRIIRAFKSKDGQDVYSCGAGNELVYEGMVAGHGSFSIKFFAYAHFTRESQFIDWCQNSSNLFGCIGLRSKQYCILNKQYTKEEYEALVPKIIEHMNTMPYVDQKGRVYKYGEFFPTELSPFAYNETIAQEYFPLTKEEAERQGYTWKEREKRDYKITKKPEDLPDNIKDVPDGITKEIIGCAHGVTCNEQCTEAFKIIESELAFYRRMNLPLPRLCPNCRHYQRLKQRNPLKLWHRKCQCAGGRSDPSTGSGQATQYQNTIEHFHESSHCPNEFETSYSPERPEIVYCEKCYQSEVV